MKKLTVALSASVLAALALSGCASGGAPTDPNAKPELLIYVDATREAAAQAYVDSVGDAADITVEVYDDLIAKLTLFDQTKSGWPDVAFLASPASLGQLTPAGSGFVAPIDDLVASDVLDGYEGANSWCSIDGQTYCLANDLAQSVLWYDKTTLDSLGLTVPTTMEEFAETALALKGTGYIAGSVDGYVLYTSFLQSSGCPLSDVQDATTVKIDVESEECQRVAETLQPLIDAGVVDTRSAFDAGFIADEAGAGKVAMQVGPSWFGDFVIKAEASWAVPAGRISAAPMPSWDGSKPIAGQWGGGLWLVSSHSEFPQAAADAATWLATSPDVQVDSPTYPAYGPVNAQWADRTAADTYYASDPVPAMQESAKNLSTVNKPALFDPAGPLGTVVQPALDAKTPLVDVLKAYADELTNVAKSVGYTVVD